MTVESDIIIRQVSTIVLILHVFSFLHQIRASFSVEGFPCVFYQNETVISWSRSFLQKFGASVFQLTTTFATFVEGVACDGFSPQ